jgi:hypothetical protein
MLGTFIEKGFKQKAQDYSIYMTALEQSQIQCFLFQYKNQAALLEERAILSKLQS